MVKLQSVISLINARKNRVLRVAELALPPQRFKMFRQVFLDELGREGLESELAKLFAEDHQDREGTGRNIHAGKEVPP